MTTLSNSDQHQNTHWMIIHDMTRRVSSERGGNGAGIRAVRAGDPPRIVRVAGLHRDHRNGGAAAVHAAEERGEAEAALAFAASIVESSDDAIVGMTLYGMVTNRSAGAEWLHGYTAREVLGRWPRGITIPEDDLPNILERVGRGERVTHYETVGVKKTGGASTCPSRCRRSGTLRERLSEHRRRSPVASRTAGRLRRRMRSTIRLR